VASNREPMTGELKLGVIPTISPFLLPRVLPALKTQYPSLRLYLVEEQTAPLLVRLRSGDIDAALIALPYDIEGLASRILFEDEFEFACNENHPLAGESMIPPGALADQPLMLLEEGHCLRGHALDACQLHHGHLRAQLEASSLHTLVQMVGAGIGITLLPKLAIDAQITRGTSIKLIPLSSAASRHIGLVWRQTSLRSQEFEMLGGSLADLVAG
jgi:LysR family hydrogen peroxide-inducible transcriptional activator